MRVLFEILKLRWLICRRAVIDTSSKDRIKIAIYVILFVTLGWLGVGSLMSRLHAELDERIFAVVPWWTIVTVGALSFFEGLRSTIRALYQYPENDLLLSLPIPLNHLFLVRWLERLLVNVCIMLICALVLFQYSRFAPVSWTYILISINVLLMVQQLQFLCAIEYSRKTGWGSKNVFCLMAPLVAIVVTISVLYFSTLQAISTYDIYTSCLMSIVLLMMTLMVQQLFVSSLYREYQIVEASRFRAVRSFHKQFIPKNSDSANHKVRSLLIKDAILILRQIPILQAGLSVVLVIVLSFVMYAQQAEQSVGLFSVFVIVITFIWTLYVFEFDRKQIHQMVTLRGLPISGKEIWHSKYLFVLLLVGVNSMLLLVPAVLVGFDPIGIVVSIGILSIHTLLVSFLAVAVLFMSYPFLKVGEYMYVVFIALFYSIVLVFPFTLVLVGPIGFFNYRKGLAHIERMEH